MFVEQAIGQYRRGCGTPPTSLRVIVEGNFYCDGYRKPYGPSLAESTPHFHSAALQSLNLTLLS